MDLFGIDDTVDLLDSFDYQLNYPLQYKTILFIRK